MELVLKDRRAFRPYRLRTQRYAVLVAHRRCGKRSGSSLEKRSALMAPTDLAANALPVARHRGSSDRCDTSSH
jgi:hypothetical protein